MGPLKEQADGQVEYRSDQAGVHGGHGRAQTTKLELNKYDPVVRKHVPFKEAKIK
jgi:hypothetical protein